LTTQVPRYILVSLTNAPGTLVNIFLCFFLQREAEKREAWKKKGHGEFREVTEGDFLGEVTGSEKVICHFYHKEFYRCKYAFLLLFIESNI